MRGRPRQATSDGRSWESDDLARKLVIIAAVRVALVTLFLGALIVFVQLRLPERAEDISIWQYVLIAAAYGLSLVYLAALRFEALVLPLAYAQIFFDSLIVSVLVFMTGGIESVFAFAFVFTLLGASSTLYGRGAIIAFVCSALMLGTIVLIQVDGTVALLPRVRFGNAVFGYVMVTAGFGLVAALSSALTENLRKTGRRLVESQIDLERLEELHAAILRSLPAGLMTIDDQGTIRYVNESAVTILGIAVHALVGQRIGSVVPCMERAWNRQGARIGAVRERYEDDFERSDGTVIKVGYSFASLGVSEPWTGYIVVFQDVTDIVRLKQAVERSERLATVGKLAAGLAHEVRNPLASMCASIDVIQGALSPPPNLQRLMDNVVSEADRLNALITDFLTFARPRQLRLERVDLGALVDRVLEVFRNEPAAASLPIDAHLEADLQVELDGDSIRQVLWNLLRNACDSMGAEGGVLTVTVRTTGPAAELSVKDTGHGVSAEEQRHIFDPFYTTKEKGSGLGLAIAYSIIQAHEGEMIFNSVPGEGSEVLVRFPLRKSISVELSPSQAGVDVGKEEEAQPSKGSPPA